MKRHTAWVAAVGMTVACGGAIDAATDPAEKVARSTLGTLFEGEMGRCQVSIDSKNLTGTCLEPAMCDFYQRNNPDCLNRPPVGPFVRDQNCQRIPIDLGRRCRYYTPQ